MKVCNKNHEEIVFDDGPEGMDDCPFCETLESRTHLEFKKLANRFKLLRAEVEPLKAVYHAAKRMDSVVYCPKDMNAFSYAALMHEVTLKLHHAISNYERTLMSDVFDDQYGGFMWEDEQESDEIVVLKVERETEKAWLMQLELGYSWWLPKSQCTFDGRRMIVEIPSWLVQKKTDEEEEAARNKRELENEARKIAEDEMDERHKL